MFVVCEWLEVWSGAQQRASGQEGGDLWLPQGDGQADSDGGGIGRLLLSQTRQERCCVSCRC